MNLEGAQARHLPNPHHRRTIIAVSGISQRRFGRGVSISKRAIHGDAPIQSEKVAENSVAATRERRHPNMRMKLTARGGRVKRLVFLVCGRHRLQLMRNPLGRCAASLVTR
jgi:hypothetical protein